MKKIIIVLIAVILLFAVFNIFNISIYDYLGRDYDDLVAKDYNGVNIDEVDNYNIDIKFEPEQRLCKIKQTVDYINKENTDLNQIYFHLYPNAFRENIIGLGLVENVNPDYEPGYIEFLEIKINGKVIDYEIIGADKTLLKLELDNILKPKDRLIILMDYTLKIPSLDHRFGHNKSTFNFGNWYPIAAVYDQKGWNLSEYYVIGDPFYSDVGNYNISIEAPSNYEIAVSGKILSEEILEDKKIWKIRARLMRDFAWVASDEFAKRTHNLKDTQLKLYFLTDNKDLMNHTENIASQAMQVYNKKFGEYPYGQVSIVETNFLSGGMEYPGLVYIDTDKYIYSQKTYLSEYIVHELAHQWWYSAVGNNQITDPWLDEGLATYSQIIFSRETKGKAYSEGLYRSLMGIYNNSRSDKDMLTPVTEFTAWNDYSAVAYGKGAAFLHDIEQKYGTEDVDKILQIYYKRFKFKNAFSKDFFKIVEEVVGVQY